MVPISRCGVQKLTAYPFRNGELLFVRRLPVEFAPFLPCPEFFFVVKGVAHAYCCTAKRPDKSSRTDSRTDKRPLTPSPFPAPFHAMKTVQFEITGKVLVSDADFLKLWLHDPLMHQTWASRIQSHVSEGPLCESRECSLRVGLLVKGEPKALELVA